MPLALMQIAQEAIKIIATTCAMWNHLAPGVLHAAMRRLFACLAVSLLVLRMLLGADVAMAAGERCDQAAVAAMSTHCAHGGAVSVLSNACTDCAVCHAVALPLSVAAVPARSGAQLPAAQANGAFASAPVALALKPPIAHRIG